MFPSTVRLAAIAQARTPLIKFLGPRSALHEEQHAVTRHPAAPADAEYPLKATAPKTASPSTSSSKSSTTTTQGPLGTSRQVLDFANLPARYRHPVLTEAEIEAVETGGATIIY